ncbi:hypothetical protein CR513_55266, partial [Mucuna pruriens]
MRWFSSLPPRSIDSFSDLVVAFESQFATNKAKCMEVAYLFDIKQAKIETLNRYLARFNGATIQAFQKGLRTGPFSDSLALSRPSSMTEIRTWVEKHAEKELLAVGKKIGQGVQAYQYYGLGGVGHKDARVEKYAPFKATRA